MLKLDLPLKRTFRFSRTGFCRWQLQLFRTSSTFGISSELASLRASASTVLTRKDFERVRWVGVFGSFAVGKQTDDSDVDVVAIEEPLDPNVYISPETLHLEDILPRIWGRKVDVVHITPGEDLRGYVSLESLLSSRTLYGSDEDASVIQLRKEAQSILDSGPGYFTNILNDIESLKSMVSKLSYQEFISSSSTRRDAKDGIISILEAINVQPMWHPLHDAFWFPVIQPAVALRQKLDENDSQSMDATAATNAGNSTTWEIATASGRETLWDVDRRIRKFVFPVFELTHEKIEMTRKLEKQEIEKGVVTE